jgi:hypothetical protein
MKYRNLILLLAILWVIAGCNKDNSTNNTNGILIKGTISAVGSTKSTNLKATNTAYTLADAKKILVFNSSGGYQLFNIEDSSFAARAMQGTACALVFLSEDNSFIGCLQSGGLNMLPLVSLKDGDKTIIDLSNLTLEGSHVIPSNNPIGNEINLNPAEIERYRQFGAFFESLSRNIDTDGDGIPDLIGHKGLYVSTIYDVNCGMWGLNNTAPEIIDTSRLTINYTLRVWGEKSIIPQNTEVTLSGPAGSPYNDIEKSYYTPAPDGFITFFRRPAANNGNPYASSFLPFGDGTYALQLDNKTYSLLYSKVDAKYFLVQALPTVHTNGNNEITSISVEYKDMQGEKINPENFVYQTMVQLNNGVKQLEQIGALWENPEAKTNTELYNYIPKTKINESELTGINVCYLDLVGNSYNIVFRKAN